MAHHMGFAVACTPYGVCSGLHTIWGLQWLAHHMGFAVACTPYGVCSGLHTIWGLQWLAHHMGFAVACTHCHAEGISHWTKDAQLGGNSFQRCIVNTPI